MKQMTFDLCKQARNALNHQHFVHWVAAGSSKNIGRQLARFYLYKSINRLSNYRNEHRNTNDLRAVSIGSSKGLQVILRTKSIVCSDLSYNLQLTSDGLVSHSFLISRTYHCVGFGSRREWVTGSCLTSISISAIWFLVVCRVVIYDIARLPFRTQNDNIFRP